MLNAIKSLFSSETEAPAGPEDPDLQTAFAALLIEAARADEHYDDMEKAIITRVIKTQFSLEEAGAVAVREKAETAQTSANGLHQFTREVKTLPESERAQFLEHLWTVILSDGVRDAWEDSLVRRIASLIHMTDRASGEARQRAAAKLG